MPFIIINLHIYILNPNFYLEGMHSTAKPKKYQPEATYKNYKNGSVFHNTEIDHVLKSSSQKKYHLQAIQEINKARKTKGGLYSSCRQFGNKTTKRQAGYLTSKSAKSGSKWLKKIELPKKSKKSAKQLQGQVSYREYCVLDNSFLPLKSKQERELLDKLLQKTSSTSPNTKSPKQESKPLDLSPLDYLNFNQFGTFVQNASAIQHSQQINNSYSESAALKTNQVKNSRHEKYASEQLKVTQDFTDSKPQMAETGIQYTQRSNIQSLEQLSLVEQKTQRDETIEELFMKLQFKHLPNDKIFSQLTRSQKDHYSELLGSIMEKLMQSPRQRVIPVSKQQATLDISPRETSPRVLLHDQIVKKQIYIREYQQLGYMQKLCKKDISSMNAIIQYLQSMFCFIELNYCEEFIFMIRRIYGLKILEKFQEATRTNYQPPGNVRILDERLFKQINTVGNEDQKNNEEQNEISEYEFIHRKAIFDCANECLDHYRPFYKNQGQYFPWSLKMFPAISEYAIDQDSIPIIFSHIKDQIVNIGSSLCGLIITNKDLQAKEINEFLMEKRKEKQDILITECIKEYNDDVQTETYCTGTLFKISQLIYQELLMEIGSSFF